MVVWSVHLKSRGSTNDDEKLSSPYFAGTQRAHKASHDSKLITRALDRPLEAPPIISAIEGEGVRMTKPVTLNQILL